MTDTQSSVKNIAVDIFLFSQENQNPTAVLLKTLSVLGKADAGLVLKEYENLLNGSTKIVKVRSAEKLTDSQKKNLESKIRLDYQGDLIFSYNQDETLVSGFCFQIEDQMFDGSLEALLK